MLLSNGVGRYDVERFAAVVLRGTRRKWSVISTLFQRKRVLNQKSG